MRIQTIAVCSLLAVFLISFGSEVTAQVRVDPAEMAERITYQTPPRYPQQARDARIQGTVQLDVVIDEAGFVAELNVITGHPLLAEASQEAVSQWRYDPYRVGGLPVAVTTTVNVTFTLN